MPLPTVNPMISRSPFPATSSTMSRLHHPTMDALEFHRSAFSTNPIFPGSSTGTTGGGGTPGGDATSFAFAAFSWYSSMERLMSSTMPALGERRAERARRAEARAGAATRGDEPASLARGWGGGGGRMERRGGSASVVARWGVRRGVRGRGERFRAPRVPRRPARACLGSRAGGRASGGSVRGRPVYPLFRPSPRRRGGRGGASRAGAARGRRGERRGDAPAARGERGGADGGGGGGDAGHRGRREARCGVRDGARGDERCGSEGSRRRRGATWIAIREIFERLDSHTNTFFYCRKG
jgi:hypothetical protein